MTVWIRQRNICSQVQCRCPTEAYQMIETDYGCLRMKNIHRYMANVQTLGGDVTDAIKMLKDDLRNWGTASARHRCSVFLREMSYMASWEAAFFLELVILGVLLFMAWI